jgi:RHS repeat-associated protein
VLATVSDRKFGVPSGCSSLIDHFDPHIVTAQDYYPFGMLSRVSLPGSGKSYRFGFNGKENDNDVKGGLGNQQDYGMRIYDGRIGKFLSVDPLTKSYPELTPYQFASNKLINSIDLDGLEGWELTSQNNKLKNYGKHLVLFNPVDNMIRREQYNPEVLMRDMYGTGVSGRKTNVQNNIASVKLQHDMALGEKIASGPGASIGYLTAGEKGASVGAAFDQALFAFSAVPGEGYLSKPNYKKMIGAKAKSSFEPDVIPKGRAIVYRTQGVIPPNASEHRIRFDKNRNITIEGDEMLYITINDKNHQVYFYDKRGGVDNNSYILSFQVPASLLEEIKANAVRQKEMTDNPGAPQISDLSKSGSAYGLPKEYIDKLRKQAIPGSGKIETPIKNF